MRLTLRTLLAYLDGILEPGDAQDLAKKVEESEFASGLVHRIRDVMRRLRLGAPSLNDRGPGLDPNTVSEYLDNTLASDRVTDFEKVCLDSDMHLAEVAACHQILTLVLGEPAEVDPASRQRMYELKNAVNLDIATENGVTQIMAGQDISTGTKPPPTPAASSPSVSPSLSLDLEEGEREPAERKARTKPTVPEYLREPGRRPVWWHVAAALLLAVGFAGAVLFAFGQFESGTMLGNVLVRWGVVAESPELASAKTEGSGERGEGREEKTPETPPAAVPSEGTSPEIPPPGSITPPTTPETPIPPAAVAPGKEPAAVAPVQPPAPVIDPTIPPTVTPSDIAPKPALVPGVNPPVAPVEPPAVVEPENPPPPPAAPPLPEPLGRLMSSEQVLLHDDPSSGWTRVAPNQMLTPEGVLTLPTYRAKVALTAGVALEIVGGTHLTLLGSTPQDPPGIQVVFGRVVLMPVAKAGAQLRVSFGNRSGTLTFVDSNSIAALEVRRGHAPGTNPEDDAPTVTADLYVTTGAVLWDETVEGKAAQPHRLASPQRLGFDAQLTTAPVAPKELPAWIAAEPISQLDRRASIEIARALPTDRPARVGLLELATSRPQREVKWLALRCLGYVGQFRDMVAALNDASFRLSWPDYIDALRAAVARDAETAEAVRMAIEKQYPEQAANLYRMLWGYTDKDLAGAAPGEGEDAKLVRFLDDDMLAVRVLAIWNLMDITGLGQNYQPEQTSARRQAAVRRWRQRLEAKEIRLPAVEEKAPAATPPPPVPAPIVPPSAARKGDRSMFSA